ncbi:hypothetical protein DQ04_03821030 [Trypanosoma grayi]|uniref:hypothetical protein n=1 Tax=Trypanosoma grayi TaxID=71804 RepID=UPI0004F49E0A|nr:hypothetical protein DQ04_03821030 [Trypanosoma grayi]KEG10361.1 hypothetical protein DQ04_03821030 [Trypanosoma grayi]
MESPSADQCAKKRLVLAELLAARTKDTVADVSRAIRTTFFNGAALNMGGVFLTSAAAARRGNLTETMLFHDGVTKVASVGTNDEEGGGRWVRGVLIASGTLSPPPDSIFLSRKLNGRTLFARMSPLLLRVVGVPLATFIPQPDRSNSKNSDASAASLQEYRYRMQQCEHRFLQDVEACLMWLLHCRQREKAARACMGKRSDAISHTRRRRSSPLSVSPALPLAPYFSEEPATLSVPVYYLPLQIEDNATSRLADVVDVATGFMDLLVDAEASIAQTTTAFLVDIVRLSQELQSGDEQHAQAFDEGLYDLHRRAAALLDAAHSPHCSATGGSVVAAATVFDANDENDVPLAEMVLDDSPRVLRTPPPAIPVDGGGGDDDDDDDASRCSTSSAAGCSGNQNHEKKSPTEDRNRGGGSARPLPGVLVHCMKGVSRSPSIIMAYYLQKCRVDFYALSRVPRRHTREAAPVVVASSAGDGTAASVVMGVGAPGVSGDNEEMYTSFFLQLLQCMREARPVVNPQVCFLVELRSMWSRLAQGVAEEEAERLL